jgi:hypothetical protein
MIFTIYTKLTDDLHQHGKIYPGGYSYSAKVYGTGSTYGIEGGRISKLGVRDRKGRIIISYDRGYWDEQPSFLNWQHRAILRAIVRKYDGPWFTCEVERQRRYGAAADDD